MQIIPAIDLLNGQCVRLLHGDFNACTVYADSAIELAEKYHEAGANWLHVVDLAASRDGEGADNSSLFELLGLAPQKVQTGGGVRSKSDIAYRLEQGADRVVVGSLSVTRPEVFKDCLREFGADQVVAALDIQFDENGVPFPRVFGWTESGDRSLWSLLEEFTAAGLKHLLCTDIGRDGALSGPNVKLYQQLVSRYPGLQVQASGGVASIKDLVELKATGASGAITGKALLEGLFTVNAAIEAVA